MADHDSTLEGKKRPFRDHESERDTSELSTPPVKRRFFPDEPKEPLDVLQDDEPTVSPLAIRSCPSTTTRRSQRGTSRNGSPAKSPPKTEPEPQPGPDPSAGSGGFDQATFESFVGTSVPIGDIAIIRQRCGNNLERAVNMYFDDTYKKAKKKPSPSPFAALLSKRSESPVSMPATDANPPGNSQYKLMPSTRYIGAFGVEGWATRSGRNILKHGDIVKIERQKIQAPKKGVKAILAASRRVDVAVRFTLRDSEIGRLSKDAATWVSTLIDQGICLFEGIVVYAPEVISTNATIFLQLRAYLLRGAFASPAFQMADNRPTGMFDQAETSEEKEMRQRQVALVKLLQEVSLMPISRGDGNDTKSRRDEFLQAAETADKEPPKNASSLTRSKTGTPAGEDTEESEEGQVLEQDQLDALYQKAQMFDISMPEAEPASTFALSLRPYQKQALHWMMSKEKDEKTNREESLHPLWEEYAWPRKDVEDKDLPRIEGQCKFYLNPYSGELSLDFPAQEQHCLGGVLADEMGLGKTIQMLSLMHSHRSEIALCARRAAEKGGVKTLQKLSSAMFHAAPCTTLVVAPMSLLSQWESEAKKASAEGSLKTLVYYGTEKSNNLADLCREANAASAPDLVITSYGIVLSEFGQIATNKGDKSRHQGLFALKFFRVILDEAHNIRNRQSKTAKACYELAADHRWLLTGTPIVNKLEDLFSLIRFLRVEPWNNFSFWRTFITVPFESKNFVRALDVVQTVLEPLVLRRTKDMKTPDGQPLVPLPPKHVEIVPIEFGDKEKEVYDYVFTMAKSEFKKNLEAGTVMRAFTTIFAQILRLRQTCCHPLLIRKRDVVAEEDESNAAADAATGFADDMDLETLVQNFTVEAEAAQRETKFEAHVLQQIRDEAASECPVCAEEPMIEQTVTACFHSACKKCLLSYIKYETDRAKVPRCVSCRQPINSRDLFEVVRHDEPADDMANNPFASKAGQISLQRIGINDSSAKIVALISHLRAMRRENPYTKAVVFSQFTSFLTLIEGALTRAGIRFVRLDGTMAQQARAKVLDAFRDESKGFLVLLISLRAGGVGLNLTSARAVFMMDPWWSFAVEAQAIDRVHRMGQTQEVKVVRFIVKGSVEERMLKVQDRKKFIATSLGMMNDEEKKLQRIDDIRELLG